MNLCRTDRPPAPDDVISCELFCDLRNTGHRTLGTLPGRTGGRSRRCLRYCAAMQWCSRVRVQTSAHGALACTLQGFGLARAAPESAAIGGSGAAPCTATVAAPGRGRHLAQGLDFPRDLSNAPAIPRRVNAPQTSGQAVTTCRRSQIDEQQCRVSGHVEANPNSANAPSTDVKNARVACYSPA